MSRRRPLVRPASLLPLAFVPLVAAGCATEVEKRMESIAGTYVHEQHIDPATHPSRVKLDMRNAIVLRADGRWEQTTTVDFNDKRQASSADSGTYRVKGVQIALISEVERGVPYKYTVSNDTLYGANAALAKAVTGMDIGETVFVRQR